MRISVESMQLGTCHVAMCMYHNDGILITVTTLSLIFVVTARSRLVTNIVQPMPKTCQSRINIPKNHQ